MIKEIPQPIVETADFPAPMAMESADLSHDLNIRSGRNIKKLGGVMGLTAAISLAGTGAVRGQEKPESSLSPEEPTPIVSFMEIADKNEDGKLDVGEVVIAIPEYLQAIAQRTEELVESQHQEDNTQPSITNAELLDNILNQDEKEIKNPNSDSLFNNLDDLWDKYGETLNDYHLPLSENKNYSREDFNKNIQVLINKNKDGWNRFGVSISIIAKIFTLIEQMEADPNAQTNLNLDDAKKRLVNFADKIYDYTINNIDKNKGEMKKGLKKETKYFVNYYLLDAGLPPHDPL